MFCLQLLVAYTIYLYNEQRGNVQRLETRHQLAKRERTR